MIVRMLMIVLCMSSYIKDWQSGSHILQMLLVSWQKGHLTDEKWCQNYSVKFDFWDRSNLEWFWQSGLVNSKPSICLFQCWLWKTESSVSVKIFPQLTIMHMCICISNLCMLLCGYMFTMLLNGHYQTSLFVSLVLRYLFILIDFAI